MDSLYDQFAGHEAEPIPERRDVGWQANRQDNTQPYVNNNPKARVEAPETQKDLSYYAWWRFVSNRQSAGGFEQGVNIQFKSDNGTVDGKNYDEMRAIYVSLYKSMIKTA